jgi:hypothetical protein
MNDPAVKEMFGRLMSAEGQGRAAKTVEVFGWLILFEGATMLLIPHFVAWLLRIPPLVDQAANYFRLVGLLTGGLGMLYIVSGRLDAQGFVFASLLDRPLVPPVMALLWYLDIIPGAIALAFSIQDFGSFLWTLVASRRR